MRLPKGLLALVLLLTMGTGSAHAAWKKVNTLGEPIGLQKVNQCSFRLRSNFESIQGNGDYYTNMSKSTQIFDLKSNFLIRQDLLSDIQYSDVVKLLTVGAISIEDALTYRDRVQSQTERPYETTLQLILGRDWMDFSIVYSFVNGETGEPDAEFIPVNGSNITLEQECVSKN